jgi:hypothetical protein
VGKKVQYVKNDKVYHGVVDREEDPFIVVKFDEFPTGIGQGQIVEIIEGPEDEEQSESQSSQTP